LVEGKNLGSIDDCLGDCGRQLDGNSKENGKLEAFLLKNLVFQAMEITYVVFIESNQAHEVSIINLSNDGKICAALPDDYNI